MRKVARAGLTASIAPKGAASASKRFKYILPFAYFVHSMQVEQCRARMRKHSILAWAPIFAINTIARFAGNLSRPPALTASSGVSRHAATLALGRFGPHWPHGVTGP